MRQLDALTPAEIKAAIPMVFPEDGHAESRQVMWAVALKLDSSSQAVPQGYWGNRVQERYAGRVKRALDALAADGALIRVGSNERPPGGTSPGGVHYYTPDAFAAAKAQSEKDEAEALAVSLRWDLVANRLDAVEVCLRPNGSLTLTDWEHLLEATGL